MVRLPSFSLLPLLAINALAALLLAAGLLLAGHGAPQLAAHLALALGILPLILAAMIYFVPVLTRSGPAPRLVRWIAALAWCAGALAVGAFASDFSSTTLQLAALLAMLAAGLTGGWALRRVRRMFGPRHHGIDWYLAALGFLLLALAAVWLMPVLPAWRAGLRLFHLHANLLGFVGLTALGTLQVLLPTTLGQADPAAANRLQHDLPWAVAGVLLVALGAASVLGPHLPQLPQLPLPGGVLAAVGGLLFGWPVWRMLRDWQRRFGPALFQAHGAAPSLLVASVGLLALLLLGIGHGLGLLSAASARSATGGFILAFLVPLVSGAAIHLFPIWLRPGPRTAWHDDWRARYGRGSRWRGVLWLVLGLGLCLAHG